MKLSLWVLGLATCLISVRAQETPPAADAVVPPPAPLVATASNTVPRTPAFVTATNIAPAAAQEMVAEVNYNNIALGELIAVLAEQAGLMVQLDPQMNEVIGRQVNFTAQNVSAAQALDKALAENSLVLIRDPESESLAISARDSALSQAVANAGPTTGPVDLAEGEPDTTLEQLANQGGEVPVIQAIQMMARLGNVSIQFDPQVRTGARRVVGTNVVEIPGIATNTVNLADFRGALGPDQVMEAILENHGLVLIPNQRTGVNTVTFRDPTAKDPMFTHVLQLKYSSPTNMLPIIQGTLSDPRSRVSPNPRTGQLVLYTTQNEYSMITNIVTQVDIPTRQVLIEARLVETSRSPSTIKGIDWSPTLAAQNVTIGNGNTIGETVTTIPGTSTGGQTPNGRPTGGSGQGYGAQTVLSTVVGAGGLSMDTARGFYPKTAFLNADGIQAVLSFINSDTESDLTANPRVVMLDNQTATLAVTRAFPIFEITPGSANSPAGARVIYTNLGTILTVTPKIAADDNVSLLVVPEVSDIVAKDRQTINGLINEANVYAIRKIETEVSIPSGHTLVMGGLTSASATREFTKVPLLGDLPGVGRAFRREGKRKQKVNLIIFVTPTIIEGGDFHETSTDFLQQKPVIEPDVEESAWDSARPKDWRKKKSKTP